MKTSARSVFPIIISLIVSFAITFATYFYSYNSYLDFGWVTLVNRGWPLAWAIETHSHVRVLNPPAFYPFDFQTLNFSIDMVFWATVLTLPSFLYLYRKKLATTTIDRSRATDVVGIAQKSSKDTAHNSRRGTILRWIAP